MSKASLGRVKATRSTVVAPVEQSLDQLAKDINLAHEGVERAALQTVVLARQAGVLLLEVKKRIPHGGRLKGLSKKGHGNPPNPADNHARAEGGGKHPSQNGKAFRM